jgi:Na+-transporting NADH:ubiquinone oxidoreductase subunit F
MAELLLSILVLAALGGVLALLLVIADAVIANYGECRITINQERKETVQGGASLLSSLMSKKIFIPSACGGRGTCAYCKVKVKEGGGPLLPFEEPYLSPKEREQGIRLSCQVKVRSDMAIEIPEELFNIREYRATVDKITDLTYDIKGIRFKLIEPDSIKFRAGQYIQLRAPKYEGNKEDTYRAYSMSSPPREKNVVETVIRLVPNGICTTWVFNHMKEGDEVLMNGPYGEFFLRPTDTRIVFVAGGSGFAPFKAMLLEQGDEINRRGARFFFGARAVKDLFYTDMMKDIEKKLPNFKFLPALSQPDPDDKWEGEQGLITEVLDRHIEDAANTEFYLCGSPGMIDACLKVMHSKGAKDDVIFYDKFA